MEFLQNEMDDLGELGLTDRSKDDKIIVNIWIKYECRMDKTEYGMPRAEAKCMHVQSVDLYRFFNMTPPDSAAAQLRMWIPDLLPLGGGSRRRPAVLILPGGGYGHVSDRELEPVALRFVAKGYAAFGLQYSCAPHRFPVALREAAMAMKFIRQQAVEYLINTHLVAAVGFSAGGHLCGTLGTLFDTPELSDLGSADQLRPDVLGLCYPVAVSWGKTHAGSFQNLTGGDAQLSANLSLDRLVRPDMPPAFIWHTRLDASVPCRNSLLLATAMEEAGVDFALHIYYRGCHGLSLADETVYPVGAVPPISSDVLDWVDAMLTFFEEQGLRMISLE